MDTSLNNLNLQAGDRVCYSESHWAWLDKAGLVLMRSRREAFAGRITLVAKTHVLVNWDAGQATPHRPLSKRFPPLPMPTSHLVENLVSE